MPRHSCIIKLARLMPIALMPIVLGPASAGVTMAARKCVPEDRRASTRRSEREQSIRDSDKDRMEDEQINTDAMQERVVRHFVPGIFMSTLSKGL